MLLILASNSPRRSAILTQLGIKFRAEPSLVKEDAAGRPPLDLPRLFAEEKAVDVSSRNGDILTLGFDTLVFLDNSPLGKPKDRADAIRALSELSGRTHQVISGFAAARGGRLLASGSETTRVTFRTTTPKEIEAYVATGEPMDKAGSYAIQGLGARFVKSIDGCFYNVVGLPVSRTLDMLASLGERDVGL